MPKKRTLILLTAAIVIIAALCLLIGLLPEKEEEDAPSETVENFLFDSNTPDSIDSLAFVCADNDLLSLVRVDDNWQVEGRANLPLSEHVVAALLGKLEHMLSLRTVNENCTDPAEYGLEQPYCKITLVTEGERKSYLFGGYSEYYAGYYCMIEGDTSVYMVEEGYVSQFDLTLEDLLGSDHLPDLGNLRSAVWTSADGSSITAFPEGEHSALLTLLSSLELGRWIDYGNEQNEIYGLDSPAVAKLTLWDGASLTLSFGIGETDEFIYLRIGESEMIYLADCDELARLGEYIRGTV